MPSHNISQNRDLRKFYERVCLQLDDLLLDPDSGSKTSDHANLSSVRPQEEELYGKITKDEFIKILDSYNKQQESQELQGKSVKCDGVVGGSFAKLLYSRPGFHHLSSTSHLAQDLQIRNIHRNCFLGGQLSSFSPDESEDLAGLKKYHHKLLIKQITDRANDYIGNNQLDLASKEILSAYNMDQRNGDVLATRGRYYAARKEYSSAIKFFKSALNHQPHNERHIRMYLSDTLYQYGYIKYNRHEFREAKDLLESALDYNPDNDGARLHKNLCEDALQKNTLFAQKPPAYRK